MRHFHILIPATMATALLAGCAIQGGSPLTTSALKPKEVKTDPVCIALRDRIIALRTEGTVTRVEKAAAGKTKLVRIKRTSLNKVAELNQANAEFQAQCAKLPTQATAKPTRLPGTIAAPATNSAEATVAAAKIASAKKSATATKNAAKAVVKN